MPRQSVLANTFSRSLVSPLTPFSTTARQPLAKARCRRHWRAALARRANVGASPMVRVKCSIQVTVFSVWRGKARNSQLFYTLHQQDPAGKFPSLPTTPPRRINAAPESVPPTAPGTMAWRKRRHGYQPRPPDTPVRLADHSHEHTLKETSSQENMPEWFEQEPPEEDSMGNECCKRQVACQQFGKRLERLETENNAHQTP